MCSLPRQTMISHRGRGRLVTVISMLAMLFILNYNYTHTIGQADTRHISQDGLSSKSNPQTLILTLGLPDGLMEADILVKLYHYQLQSQLEQETYKDTGLEIYDKRKQQVKETCNRMNETFNSEKNIRNMWMIFDPKLLYCPVFKSGSTFWSKAIQVLKENNRKTFSPFQFFNHYGFVNDITLKNIIPKENMTSISRYLDSSLKFIFVRNPYSRVYSVYVDKVLAPNIYFMPYQKYATTHFRNGTKQNDDKRGLTFKEFVMVLLDKSRDLDKHLKPIYETCDLCGIDYDFIGKLETFHEDVQHVLKMSGSLGRRIKFKNFKYETKIDMLLYQIIRAFLTESGWKPFIGKHTAWERLWRQLQISGFIERDINYPLSFWESKNITLTSYINMALEAFQRSTSGAKANKKESYLQAYSQLSLGDLERLRTLYLPDFQLFGYDDRPKELFEMDRHFKGSFNYFDVLQG